MLVVMAAKCGARLDCQHRAEVFPDILCSRVRQWCVLGAAAWPRLAAPTLATLGAAIITAITAITEQTGPGRSFPQTYVL